jgi:hypothetical protein
MLGVKGKVQQSPAFKYIATKDRAAAARSLREILDLDWDRLIPGYGRVVDTGAKEEFSAGVAWMLSGASELSYAN